VHMCVAHRACVYSPYRGPCIVNHIPTLLGLEEYIGIAFPGTAIICDYSIWVHGYELLGMELLTGSIICRRCFYLSQAKP
jgi:hypothetical protein